MNTVQRGLAWYSPRPGEEELQPEFITATAPDVNLTKGRPRLSFSDVIARCLPLPASMNRLQKFCDSYLNFADDYGRQQHYFKPGAPFVYLQMISYGRLSTDSQNLGWLAQDELAFAILVEHYAIVDGVRRFVDWALVCPFIFVNNEMSLSTGREVYGWPKIRADMNLLPTAWTKDPRRTQSLMNMQLEVLPDLYHGESMVPRTVVEIVQDPPPTLSPSLFRSDSPSPGRSDLFNPLFSVPRAIRGSLAAMNMAFEMFLSLPIQGYDRRNLPAMTKMLLYALKESGPLLPWLGLKPESTGGRQSRITINQLTLKQFRDAEAPDLACYQALVNSKVSYDRISDLGLFGAANLLLGDPSGGLQVKIHEYPGHPIIETLGLEVESRTRDKHGTSVATLRPVLPFWVSSDLRYDTGETLCWRAKEALVWDKTESAENPGNLFNVTRGPEVQEVPGPYHYPNANLKVFPLPADPQRLLKFCGKYVNCLGSPFKVVPWGDHVFMVVTSYGTGQWNEINNIGQLADLEVAFLVPVWGFGDSRERMLMPYVFGNSGQKVISDREINGIPALPATISSEQSWLREGGPWEQGRFGALATVSTLIIPAIRAGQPAQERTLIRVAQGSLAGDDAPDGQGLSDLRERQSRELSATRKFLKELDSRKDRIAKLVAGGSVALKQYRGTERADKACYQSLVSVEREFTSEPRIGRIGEPMHVDIFNYPTMPIVERLGLKPTKTSSRGNVIQHFQVDNPFYIQVGLKEELGENLAWRVNSKKWHVSDKVKAWGSAPPSTTGSDAPAGEGASPAPASSADGSESAPPSSNITEELQKFRPRDLIDAYLVSDDPGADRGARGAKKAARKKPSPPRGGRANKQK